MRAGEAPDADPVRVQQGGEVGRDAALAVGAGDVDCGPREGAERGEELGDAREAEGDHGAGVGGE